MRNQHPVNGFWKRILLNSWDKIWKLVWALDFWEEQTWCYPEFILLLIISFQLAAWSSCRSLKVTPFWFRPPLRELAHPFLSTVPQKSQDFFSWLPCIALGPGLLCQVPTQLLRLLMVIVGDIGCKATLSLKKPPEPRVRILVLPQRKTRSCR